MQNPVVFWKRSMRLLWKTSHPRRLIRLSLFLNTDIFGDAPSRPQSTKGKPGSTRPKNAPKPAVPRNLKPISARGVRGPSEPVVIDPKLVEGAVVNHTRFGRGKVLKIEGDGSDRKAEIQFEQGAVKKTTPALC